MHQDGDGLAGPTGIQGNAPELDQGTAPVGGVRRRNQARGSDDRYGVPNGNRLAGNEIIDSAFPYLVNTGATCAVVTVISLTVVYLLKFLCF